MMAQQLMLDWWLCDFKGIRTSIAIYFFNFPGGGVRNPCPPPFGSAHVTINIKELGKMKVIFLTHQFFSLQPVFFM